MSKAMKVFGMTKEGYEFEHYEQAPLWDNVKECYKYCMTIKWCGVFDGTGGDVFMKRAMRKSDTILVKYFRTKKAYEKHRYMQGSWPESHYVFIWDRNMELVDGAF